MMLYKCWDRNKVGSAGNNDRRQKYKQTLNCTGRIWRPVSFCLWSKIRRHDEYCATITILIKYSIYPKVYQKKPTQTRTCLITMFYYYNIQLLFVKLLYQFAIINYTKLEHQKKFFYLKIQTSAFSIIIISFFSFIGSLCSTSSL